MLFYKIFFKLEKLLHFIFNLKQSILRLRARAHSRQNQMLGTERQTLERWASLVIKCVSQNPLILLTSKNLVSILMNPVFSILSLLLKWSVIARNWTVKIAVNNSKWLSLLLLNWKDLFHLVKQFFFLNSFSIHCSDSNFPIKTYWNLNFRFLLHCILLYFLYWK